MKVRFTLEALDHIHAIHFYIAGRSPRAARHIVELIYEECDRLSEFPHMGHVGAPAGSCEWLVPKLPYIIVHAIDSTKNELIVLAIFHGAQQR
jgi:plasmid stabilization system protein ParE